MSWVHENERKYESPAHLSYDLLHRLCKGKKVQKLIRLLTSNVLYRGASFNLFSSGLKRLIQETISPGGGDVRWEFWRLFSKTIARVAHFVTFFPPFKRLSCLATCWLSLTLQLEEYKISCFRTSWISWMNISFSIWLSYNLWLNQYHTVSPLNRQCFLKSYVARIYSCFDNCRQIFTRIKCMWVLFNGKRMF